MKNLGRMRPNFRWVLDRYDFRLRIEKNKDPSDAEKSLFIELPEARIELARCCHRRILSPVRLPVPPLGHEWWFCICGSFGTYNSKKCSQGATRI